MDTPIQSDLLHLVFKCTVKEDRVAEFIKIANNDMIETRKEPGNLRTELMRDKVEKNVFYINDVYYGQAGYEAHQQTPHFGMLKDFMQSGAFVGAPSVAIVDSMNVEEMCNQASTGKKDYTITYFEFHGRASAMCMMMQKANVSWEKKVLTFPEWQEVKKTQGGGLPFVQLADGIIRQESVPTAKLVAKKLGFYPEDPLSAHRCDFTVAQFTDVNNALTNAILTGDNEKIGEAVNAFPKFLDKIEAGLGWMKWMAGEQLSVADFWVGAWYCDAATNELHPTKPMFADILAKYPNLTRWGTDFKHENKAWLSMRPSFAY